MQLERGEIMTKEEIREIVMSGNTGDYSHVVICCDTFDYEDYPVYVKYGEDIRKIIVNYNDCNKMSRVMEVYNYNLDLEKQLNESISYHIEPLVKSKKTIKSNEEKKLKEEVASDEQDSNISENLKKAIDYAVRMHEGQTRLNGEPYIKHPLHVVQNVLKYKKSKNIEVLLMSACLHDTIEDTDTTYYDIFQNFGPQVASLVLELTTDEDMKNELGKVKYLKIKMKNMSSWALTIKLCDRLDNCSDLLSCSEEFQEKYVLETLDILEYISQFRTLTGTQIRLVEDILDELMPLKDVYNIGERIAKLKSFIGKEKMKRMVLNPINSELLPGTC